MSNLEDIKTSIMTINIQKIEKVLENNISNNDIKKSIEFLDKIFNDTNQIPNNIDAYPHDIYIKIRKLLLDKQQSVETNTNYKLKYFKYKLKYLNLKN
jgi:uncharacterized protein (UPF0147 family)